MCTIYKNKNEISNNLKQYIHKKRRQKVRFKWLVLMFFENSQRLLVFRLRTSPFFDKI